MHRQFMDSFGCDWQSESILKRGVSSLLTKIEFSNSVTGNKTDVLKSAWFPSYFSTGSKFLGQSDMIHIPVPTHSLTSTYKTTVGNGIKDRFMAIKFILTIISQPDSSEKCI